MARNALGAAGDDADVHPDVRLAFAAGTRGAGADEARTPRGAALVSRRNWQRSGGARQGLWPGVDAITSGPRGRRACPGLPGVDQTSESCLLPTVRL